MKIDKNYTNPQPADILGGRGSLQFNHAGNQVLRETIVDRLDEYRNPYNSRKDKHAIIYNMIDVIHATGGRFLKLDKVTAQWYVAGQAEFRMKLSHAFRDASIPNKVKCIDRMRLEKKAKNVVSSALSSEPIKAKRSPRISFTMVFLATLEDFAKQHRPRPSMTKLDELLLDFHASYVNDEGGFLVKAFEEDVVHL